MHWHGTRLNNRRAPTVAWLCFAPMAKFFYFSIRHLPPAITARTFSGVRCGAAEEVAMARACDVRSIQPVLVEQPRPIASAGTTSFVWSPGKIRVLAVFLLTAAMPAAAGFAASVPAEKWLCLAWAVGVVLLMQGLSRRASSGAVVLSVDQRGIFDRRLMSRRIEWQEIDAICPVNTDRNHTVDIKLRWPKTTLAGTRWWVRIGAPCQIGYGVPAVTISMLLLQGNVSELLDAVAQYRPDLLHHLYRASRYGVLRWTFDSYAITGSL